MPWRRDVKFEKGPVGWLQRYALLSYDHPLILFFGVLLATIYFAALGAGLGFGLTEQTNEWEIKTNKHVRQSAAITEALDQLSQETDQSPYSVDDSDLNVFVTYEVKKGAPNMFTPENLETQRRVENEIMSGTYTEVCLRDYDFEPVLCETPLSVLTYFFEYDRTTAQFGDWLADSPEAAIAAGITVIDNARFQANFFLDNGYNAEDPETKYTRSRFQLGLPIVFANFTDGEKKRAQGEVIPVYTNSKTDTDDQIEKVYDEYLKDMESELFDLLDMEKPSPLKTEYSDPGELGNLEVLFWNQVLQRRELTRVAFFDFMWAILSILSVWIYMLVHLGSVFLSVVGVFEIFLSFPVAIFFYTPCFRIEYFSQMNLLVIFILLGIGADDVFVFTDAFKQSKSVPNVDPSLQGRLMYSASRASKAVFVTSFTTMAAFFATAVSPLMPMQAFGIFAALSIVFLFLINLFLMPPALVLYAGYVPVWTQWICPCFSTETRPEWFGKYLPCCTCCHVEVDETFSLPLGGTSARTSLEDALRGAEHRLSKDGRERSPGREGTSTEIVSQPIYYPGDEPPVELTRCSSLADASVNELRAIEKFFYGPFFLFLQRAKWVILLCGLVLFAVGIGLASTFKTPDDVEDWLPPDHAMAKWSDLSRSKDTPFTSSAEDSVAEVQLVWGLKGMDPDDRDIWIGDDYGTLEYDTSFDIRPEQNQLFMLGVCPIVRSTACHADLCDPKYLIRIDRGPIADPNEIQQKCWIEAFDEWLRDTTGSGLPLPPEDFVGKVAEFLEDDAMGAAYGEDIGYSPHTGALRFVMFRFDSTYKPPAAANKVKKLIDEWEDLINGLNAQAKSEGAVGVDNGYEASTAWLWPSTADALIRGALSGLALVFVLAFVVLNFANGNVIISLIAVVTIAGIVATVMGIGIRGIMGWDLGTAESITIVILIGFSMDYTLHLSDAYMESPHSSREDRTRDALTHLGVSVTAGAVTTLISALFLWATVLIFFQKFAFNVTATIFTSFTFSIFVFPSLCLAFGPQGDFGSWSRIIGHVRKRWRGET